MATSPAQQLVSPRPDLADALEEFDLQANQAGFIGLRVAPAIEVQEAFGEYGVVPLEQMLKKRRETLRNSDGSYNRIDGEGDKDSYSCEEHGLEERVDDREARMYGNWWNAEVLAAERVRDQVLQAHEDRVIAMCEGVTNSTVIGTNWDDTASGKPVTNVRDARIKVRNRCGVIPNALVVEWEMFQVLRDSAQIIDRLNSNGIRVTDPRAITAAQLALVFDLDEVIVSGGLENTANESKAASLSSFWDKTKAFLFRKETGRNMRRPRFANTFHWGGDGSMVGGAFETYVDPSRRGTIVRNRMDTDEKKVYDACAELLTGIA